MRPSTVAVFCGTSSLRTVPLAEAPLAEADLSPAGAAGCTGSLVIGIIVGRTEVGRSLIDNAKEAVGFDEAATTTTPSPVTLVAPRLSSPPASLEIIDITDFDPAGDDLSERPERLPFINDGDASDGWHTERYGSRTFGGLKEGVGLILTLGPPQQLDHLRVGSPSLDWSVEIYAASDPAGTFIDWGEPIARASGLRGDAIVDFDDVIAATVLVWITDLGEEISTGGYRVIVTDLEVEGRPLFG